MRKNRIRARGIVAAAAIAALLLTVTACPQPDDGSKPGSNPTVISIAAIPGVTAPATGETPVAAITETAQYTGTVEWKAGQTPIWGFVAATAYTATITLTAKTGYTLQGVAANFFTVAGANSATNAANSGVVTAEFPQTGATQVASYTVTFNSNGGSTVADQTVTSGNTATEPANVTKTGYTLEGWYKEEAFTTMWIFASDTVTAAVTLYAKWTANSYIVTYDKNATDATGTMTNGSATYGQDFTLASNGYSRTGYTFGGWYDNAEGSGTAVTAVNPWNIAADKTYYAKWTANTYTVTYDKNATDATGTMTNGSATYGQDFTLASNGYSKMDYTFAGWYDNAECSGTAVTTVNPWNIAADKTYYAKWVDKKGELTTRTVSGKEIKFRYVPSGKFQRNSGAANVTVITKGYWLGETEVTQELFEAVMGINPSDFNGSSGKEAAAGETQAKRPVEQVSWYAAIAFCNKLSIADGKEPVYSVSGITDWATFDYSGIPTSSNATWNAVTQDLSKNGYRLPTEMEWMWAAMGADKTAQPNTSGYNKAFAGSTGSNSIGDYVWYNSNSSSKTHEVGKKTANELNLSDMSGNVYEWVWDWYGSYSSGTLTDPAGPASGTNRVIRGGGRSSDASSCAVTYRNAYAPNFRDRDFGFRVLAAAQ